MIGEYLLAQCNLFLKLATSNKDKLSREDVKKLYQNTIKEIDNENREKNTRDRKEVSSKSYSAKDKERISFLLERALKALKEFDYSIFIHYCNSIMNIIHEYDFSIFHQDFILFFTDEDMLTWLNEVRDRIPNEYDKKCNDILVSDLSSIISEDRVFNELE